MPAGSPLSSPLDLVLHIGSGKTGTSSIQAFLHQNRARLAELGILYPQSPGPRRHARLSLFVRPDDELEATQSWRRQRTTSPKAFRRAFRQRLFDEIDSAGLSRVLLSDEALYGAPKEALRRLHGFTDRIAGSLRLVVYLRRQDDHLVSRYQQAVKEGETRRLSERVHQLNVSRTYDYYNRLRMWKRLLEPTDFAIRRFEPECFVDGSLYQDFLDAAGIEAQAAKMEHCPSRNESLDATSLEFLRILNLLRIEHEEDAAVLPRYNRPLSLRLATASMGPTLTMPDAFLDEFMAQWKDSNRRVAREMLDDESGELFRTPRKTHNTTSEQYLDPARLDHFLALLELPERTHAPLRTLVEREAKAR
jgi:hypothetical protein